MNILQSKISGYYFKDFGAWTLTFLDARTFANESLARDFISREHVADVRMLETEVLALPLELAA